MIQLKVRLLWDRDEGEMEQTGLVGLQGYYGEAWINVDPENIREVEIEELYFPDNELFDYTNLTLNTVTAIEVWLNEGGLPAGIPICGVMGLPDHVYFIDMRENDTEEEEEE